MTPFATLADIEARYPRELLTLAADEATGLRDDARVNAAIDDVSAEIRSILMGRYDEDAFERLTEPSRAVLRAYAITMTLYRVALSFARSSERLEKGYEDAVKRLQGIADGRGKLSFVTDEGDLPPEPGVTSAGDGNVLMESAERLFTRERMRGL